MCYKTIQVSMCNNTTQGSSHSHICSVPRAQPLALQSPPKCEEGFQKCPGPLQKSFLFYILVCKIPDSDASSPLPAVPWSVGRQLGSPSHTLS